MTGMCIAAANYLIERTNEYNHGRPYSERIPMTCKRLQKLLYFGDVIYMKRSEGLSMFKDNFCAWPGGPVIPSIYDVFMQFQTGEMVPNLEGNHTPLSSSMIQALNEIFEMTIEKDTLDLVNASHIKKGPWDSVYNENNKNHDEIIEKKSIYGFYQNRDDILSTT